MHVIYLSSVDGDNRDCFPSCSQRYFQQINGVTGLTPLESHIAYIRAIKEDGHLPPRMRIAFHHIATDKLYSKFKERYINAASKGLLRRSYTLPNGNNGRK